MLKLEETKHDYYCECWETERLQEYDSWEEFLLEIDYDKQCNLLFRFDLEKTYDNDDEVVGYELRLHHALQRHGRDIWHVIIYNIHENNLKSINEFLKGRKRAVLELWKEID